MYIRDDQTISPDGVKVHVLADLLNVPAEIKEKISQYYLQNIITKCKSYEKTIHFEDDHVRIVTRISYPSIEQFDVDQEQYRKFFLEITGTTVTEMLESNGYKHQLLYEDIV
jgi:hypothetical protein